MSRTRDHAEEILTSPWLLIAAILLGFFWMLGSVPLYDLDEGAFTEATREMLASGNYITPHKDGEPRYDKPVLIYWLQAASVKLLGLNELALRLPSALAATAWLMALWLFVREHLDSRTATVAAIVMALTLEVSLIAKAAVADAVLNLFLALTFFEIYRWYINPERGTLLRVYLWMGFGFLTKGPVAVFFPVIVSFLFFLSEGCLKGWLRAVVHGWGWALFLAVALPWYIAIYLDNGTGFFESFFLHHNLGRFGSAIHGHRGFFGYYFVMLPLIMLPFTGWFLRLLPVLKRAWADPLDRFLWLWFTAVFVVFSLSQTKLPHYMLYGATPLFILMARHRELLASRWLAFTPPVLFFLLLLFLPEILGMVAGQTDKPHELAMLEMGEAWLDSSYRMAVALGLLVVLVLAFWPRLRPWQGLLLVGLVQMAVVSGVLVPRVMEILQGPVKEAARLARELDMPTVVYRTSMPSFSVYRQAITPDRDPRPGDLVFLRVDKLDNLAVWYPRLKQELVFRRGAVALVKVTAVQSGG
ncbi:MAG: glycosyltransferase family 39 protein [Chromatiaceae bacterium]|nr:glycosyltransferase family 39 protein [Chromatiaceae bacterium]